MKKGHISAAKSRLFHKPFTPRYNSSSFHLSALPRYPSASVQRPRIEWLSSAESTDNDSLTNQLGVAKSKSRAGPGDNRLLIASLPFFFFPSFLFILGLVIFFPRFFSSHFVASVSSLSPPHPFLTSKLPQNHVIVIHTGPAPCPTLQPGPRPAKLRRQRPPSSHPKQCVRMKQTLFSASVYPIHQQLTKQMPSSAPSAISPQPPPDSLPSTSRKSHPPQSPTSPRSRPP